MFAATASSSTTTDTVSFRNRAGNCLLCTTAVVCVCILVACGVMIVREYALGIGYSPTTCRVANVTIIDQLKRCRYCDKKEKAVKGKDTCTVAIFPCAQVQVNYTVKGYSGYLRGLLHPDSQFAIGRYSQCSYYICLKTKEENEAKVREFAEGWKKRGNTQFECFYNEDTNSNSLIEFKKHTKQQVIHSMLWPSVVIIICGAIFLKLEMDRRKLTCCGTQDENFMMKTSNGKDGRACNGKNEQLIPTDKATSSNVHHSLEHLANSSTNKPAYQATCSKSLSSLEQLGTNGKSKNTSSKQQLLTNPTNTIQTSCSDTGIIKNKLLKSHSDEQGRCLIPEITIDECGTQESLNKSQHSETPV